MATLTVGPGQQYTTLASAIAASKDGDVLQVQAGTYTNDFATINTKITIQGVGGMAQLVATVAPPNGKAILVINTDVTIDHLEFSGAKVADNNGAGIRYQAGNLTITNSYFHDNQDGIVGNPAVAGTGNISISNSEFNHNGAGDGYSHNIYIGDVASLTIDHSYIHNAVVGHEIKSRAEKTTVTNSRIYDNSSTASYSIDLPNGGNALIQNNVIEQGPNSQNPAIIAYGEEGSVHANSALSVIGNTILNDLNSSSASAVWNTTSTVAASITNNSFYGLLASQILKGLGTVSGSTILSVEPTLDISSPIMTAMGVALAPVTAALAIAQTSTGLASNAALAHVTQVGGAAGDSYSYTLGGTNAAAFTLTTASNTASLAVGASGLAGATGGKLYGLTITATDITSGNSSPASPLDVIVGSGGSDTVSIATLTGSLGAGTPTFVYGLAGSDTIDATGMSGKLWLVGGAGADTMTGGSGVNDYLYGAAGDSTVAAMDVIKNFHATDLIDLTGLGQTLRYADKITTNKLGAASVGWQTSGGNTFVYVNTSGSSESLKATDMKIELLGSISLNSGNIMHL